MRKVELLLQLQRVDSALDHARERLGAVLEQLGDRSELAELESERESAQVDLQGKLREQRDLETEVQDLRDKLGTLEKRLYGGTVQNPKELTDMTNEARQYRSLISSREDRLIGIYDTVEAATAAEAVVSARLDSTRNSHAEKQNKLAGERDELQALIAKRERERETLRAESDPQTLRTYEGLRRTRGGLAVAEVAQRTCQGCRISLPVNEEIRARTSPELVFCQSCGRILYGGL